MRQSRVWPDLIPLDHLLRQDTARRLITSRSELEETTQPHATTLPTLMTHSVRRPLSPWLRLRRASPRTSTSLSSPIPFIWTLHPPAAPLGALCPTTASTFHGSAHSGGASLRRCFSQEVLLSGGVADDHLRTIHPFSSSPTTSLIIPSKRH